MKRAILSVLLVAGAAFVSVNAQEKSDSCDKKCCKTTSCTKEKCTGSKECETSCTKPVSEKGKKKGKAA